MEKKLTILIIIIVLIGFGYAFLHTQNTDTMKKQKTTQQTTQIDTPEPPSENKVPFPILSATEVAKKKAIIETAKGTIEFQFLPDGPIAASNFIALTNKGFYNGLTFHRVEPGFVIQGGDPKGNGTGGPGYKFQDEKVTRKYEKGIVAMANAGPNTNGSQFFIMLADTPLPPSYTIFGKVIQGQDVVDHIAVGDVMTKVTIEDAPAAQTF